MLVADIKPWLTQYNSYLLDLYSFYHKFTCMPTGYRQKCMSLLIMFSSKEQCRHTLLMSSCIISVYISFVQLKA